MLTIFPELKAASHSQKQTVVVVLFCWLWRSNDTAQGIVLAVVVTVKLNMGTYLSTPVTDKCQESGSSEDLAWGVVDMQGWRKSMEDGHVATVLPNSRVFGVFDGHGGPEVARFCSLYLVSVLQQQETFALGEQEAPTEGIMPDASMASPKESAMGRALIAAFHALDRMIDCNERR